MEITWKQSTLNFPKNEQFLPPDTYLYKIITDKMVCTKKKKKKKFVSMAPNTVLKEHRKEQLKDYNIKGTLMQIWKSPSMFLFI